MRSLRWSSVRFPAYTVTAIKRATMFVLAHISDLHMALQPTLTQLLSKRGLGFINWHRKRKHIHRRDILDAITLDLKAQAKDHIAVTGDLVNLSLPIEYERAGDWLHTIGSSERRHRHSRQSRRLCAAGDGRARAILGRLHDRR